MKNKKSTYEDLQQNIRQLKTPEIEVWSNKYADRNTTVNLEIPEFTCICPKTGLPDFAVIFISYGPDKVCIELKSFKLYFVSYRDVGIFHEHLVNKLMDDLVAACKPRWMKIEVIMNPRGGIATTVSAEYPRGRRSKQ